MNNNIYDKCLHERDLKILFLLGDYFKIKLVSF